MMATSPPPPIATSRSSHPFSTSSLLLAIDIDRGRRINFELTRELCTCAPYRQHHARPSMLRNEYIDTYKQTTTCERPRAGCVSMVTVHCSLHSLARGTDEAASTSCRICAAPCSMSIAATCRPSASAWESSSTTATASDSRHLVPSRLSTRPVKRIEAPAASWLSIRVVAATGTWQPPSSVRNNDRSASTHAAVSHERMSGHV